MTAALFGLDTVDIPSVVAPALHLPEMTSFAPVPLRLLALPVFSEEDWPSIHLCAELLIDCLERRKCGQVQIKTGLAPYRRRFSRLPAFDQKPFFHNADRLLNRFWDYPRSVRQLYHDFDIFHVCDHSYAHLIHELPAERCGVLCQDLDTFRCVLEPTQEPRPWWFRWMTRRILDGFRRAAVVFYTTHHVRSQILAYGLVDPVRLVHAPLGIAPEFAQEQRGGADPRIATVIADGPYLLHVGSCIPRKRIDVLLEVVAGVRTRRSDVRLVKVGGTFTEHQREQIGRLGLGDAVIQVTGISRSDLAALYRGAAATLVTSDREGFGLPVIEALACGSIVIANDLPPLREGGGTAAVYHPISDLDGWVAQTVGVIDDPCSVPPLGVRQYHARQFTWEAHASAIADAYLRIARGLPPTSSAGPSASENVMGSRESSSELAAPVG